jgi:hypothetical protein
MWRKITGGEGGSTPSQDYTSEYDSENPDDDGISVHRRAVRDYVLMCPSNFDGSTGATNTYFSEIGFLSLRTSPKPQLKALRPVSATLFHELIHVLSV